MAEGEYSGKEIALEDSRGFPEDYSQERETLIFINENDEIVEKKLETGVEEILNISGLQELVDNMTEEQRSHISETELDSIQESFYSAVIHNDGTIAELTETVRNTLSKI